MDTVLYDISIPYISTLQDKFSEQANLMQMISIIFDPKYAFLIYSPIAYLLDHRVGKRLILTTVITEWLNMLLKWFLHGERPYWYVHSSGHFNTDEINIKQFPITCELGPGHPSGHAMVTAAVWFIILDSMKTLYDNWRQQSNLSSLWLTPSSSSQALANKQTTANNSNILAGLSIWTLYGILLTVVSVSRVFLGCHFPHQCLAGALLGFFVSKVISKFETSARHFIITALVLFTTAFGTFLSLQALGFDPAWTIKLATTHCIKREYIHLDTAPFFSVMRYCGFALGTGIALLMPSFKGYLNRLAPVEGTRLLLQEDSGVSLNISTGSSKNDNSYQNISTTEQKSSAVEDEKKLKDKWYICESFVEQERIDEGKNLFSSRNLCWFSAKLLMALLMARLLDNLGLFVSHSNMTLFYSCAFVAYTGFSFAFINL